MTFRYLTDEMSRQPAIYILASSKKGTLYIGVTSNLITRTWQHREHQIDGFSKLHDVTRLVWYELTEDMSSAIQREKQLKKWNRAWKIRLIESTNPDWKDLWPSIIGDQPRGSPPSRG